MIKIENTEVVGWEHAIRGMRNPKNSWKRSDSSFCCPDRDQELYWSTDETDMRDEAIITTIGQNDHDLMMRLANGGPVHAKYRRMITVYVDITAPLYWWKEFDTYKVGTVANSCSTMHKIADKEFDISDFSLEHLETIARFDEDGEPHQPYMVMKSVIDCLNACRKTYLKTKNKTDWWQMIQLLPSSYNQKRTIMLNYEVLNNIYHSRKDHKLDEWRDFCKWIEGLPYSEIITAKRHSEPTISQELIDKLSAPSGYTVLACDLCNLMGHGDHDESFCKKCRQYEYSKWAKVEHLVDISRPDSDHPHYVIGLGASESDLTDYEKELLKKSDEYWKDKEV